MSDDLSLLVRRPPQRLSNLAGHEGRLHGDAEIRDVCDDSRRIRPGGAFLCLPRTGRNAIDYIHAAEDAGAAAVISVGSRVLDMPLPHLALPDMEAAGRVLRRWFGTERTRVKVVGVTGTDGKTSVAWLLREILARKYGRAWAVGTLGWIRDTTDILDLGNTTPSLLTLHRLLAAAAAAEVPVIACEVSSHGIEQHRVAGLPFQVAVWTNLGHDHLQSHGGFEAYAALKQGFVEHVLAAGGVAVCNRDDPEVGRRSPPSALFYGRGLYREGLELGWEQELPGMLRLKRYTGSMEEVRIEEIPVGDFHAGNLAAAALALIAGGHVAMQELPALLSGIPVPPGRMQPLNIGRWQVFIDYAHTPEALTACLEAARRLTCGRLILVFGCGGERDREKRPQMGEIATRLADIVWVTSDNPRGEPAAVIASEIEQGMRKPYDAEVHLDLDRAHAIREAVFAMRRGDTLVIAGKGHEPYMEIAGRRKPWSDFETAAAALHAKADMMEFRACA